MYLGPIEIHDPRINSVNDLCASFSAIPFTNKKVPVSRLTKQLWALQIATDHESSNGFDSLQSNQVAAWTVAANPPDFLSENFFAQISSPSCMLSRREGSLMEHAMAFCSMLIGRNENAYIAIGNVKKRCYIWVVVFKLKTEHNHTVQKQRKICSEDEDNIVGEQSAIYTYGPANSRETFAAEDFELFSKIKEVRQINGDLDVLHFDTATGCSFQAERSPKFPFDRISTLFNNKNIWFNVQQTDLISQ